MLKKKENTHTNVNKKIKNCTQHSIRNLFQEKMSKSIIPILKQTPNNQVLNILVYIQI